MNIVWFYTISSVIVVSLISLIGVITLSINKDVLGKILFILVSFAAGALLGDVFIHLLPEMVENGFDLLSSILLMSGIFVFFIIEKIIHWRHCHIPTSTNHPHHLGPMNLIGDGIHNLIDGAIIAVSYMINIEIGIATTVAVVLHEIPQEIGDFGILIYAGYSRTKALFYNFLSAFFAIVGALVILLFSIKSPGLSEPLMQILIPFTAGGFIYIATADLIPELKKEEQISKSVLQLVAMLVGVAIMLLLLKIG